MLYIIRHLLLTSLFCFCFGISFAEGDSTRVKKQDFQIFLKQPAKSIRLLMYEKDFTPIQGVLSEDKKSIIIKDYKKGSRVHVKVEYEDGTIDEFVKSPCYIDPFIAFLDFMTREIKNGMLLTHWQDVNDSRQKI